MRVLFIEMTFLCQNVNQSKWNIWAFHLRYFGIGYQFSFLGVMKLFEYITICIIILSLNITLMLKTWYVLTFCIDNLSNEKCLLSINTSWHLICIWHSTVQFFCSKIKIFLPASINILWWHTKLILVHWYNDLESEFYDDWLTR